jgi:hypothetical protein
MRNNFLFCTQFDQLQKNLTREKKCGTNLGTLLEKLTCGEVHYLAEVGCAGCGILVVHEHLPAQPGKVGEHDYH